MPTKIDETHEYSPEVEYFYSPPSIGVPWAIYRNWTRSRRSRVWNDPEHRPKPEDLLSNQTAQYLQSTHVSKGMRARRVSSVPWPGGSRFETYYNHAVDGVSDPPFNIWFPSEDKWKSKFLSSVEAKTVNLGETIAEVDQSIRMFRLLGGGMFRGLKSLVRNKKLNGGISLRHIPMSILQYKFGIAPIVADTVDVVETLRSSLDLPLARVVTGYLPEYQEGSYQNSIRVLDWTGKRSWKYSIKIVLDPERARVISWGNPLEWIWERTMFSFLADYVIPIGDWINSLDALIGIKDVHGTVTVKDRFDAKVRVNKQSVQDGWELLAPGFTSYHSHKRMLITSHRDLMPVFPQVSFRASKQRLLSTMSLFALMSSNRTVRSILGRTYKKRPSRGLKKGW